MAPLQEARLAQLRRMSTAEIDDLLRTIRQGMRLPRLDYHFRQHGAEFGAGSPAEYEELFRGHLLREDLRVFTFLRPAGEVPFWALTAPETGDTVLYNEARRRIYSFYRPAQPALRMAAVEAHWIDVVRTETGWQANDQWRWTA